MLGRLKQVSLRLAPSWEILFNIYIGSLGIGSDRARYFAASRPTGKIRVFKHGKEPVQRRKKIGLHLERELRKK